MSFYELNLVALVLLNVALFYHQRNKCSAKPLKTDLDKELPKELDLEDSILSAADTGPKEFVKQYLIGHLLAFSGDWLQGPHLYAVYKYDKKLEETFVAALYAMGFVSAAMSATFIGQMADKFGRKKACLVYCATYTACCLSMLSDNLYILFAGKFCGGVSTTLLYSVFDAWMITEYHQRGMEARGLSLGMLYGWLTSLNSIVAITTGIVGEVLVTYTGDKVSPFLLAALVFVLTALWISSTWTENFGSKSADESENSFIGGATLAVKKMWQDKRIFALLTASSLFESMMYLFVFFWSAAIVSARKVAGVTADPPFGLIFACFMCAMMAGSMLFTTCSSSHNVASASHVLKTAITFASAALLSSILMSQQHLVFWAFCIVELCVGMYFPSMNFLKSSIVEDSSRAKVYSFMRLPLSTFVVLAHSFAEEGDHHRNNVFLSFGGALLVALVIAQRYLE